jgi:cyclophilin family peptidyl-prolyl cis-trans isomerase
MATDKRARKREARAVREMELRRRRNTRLIGLGVLGAIIVGLIVFGTLDDSSEPDEKTDAASEAACDAEPPPKADPQQYDAPEQVIEEGIDYRAVIHTSCGDIEMDLLEAEAPETVNSFVFLAREGYFDGLIWHRISSNFVIQTGDPDGQNGSELDGPGYSLDDENLPTQGRVYQFGVVAMANSGPNSAGSQFFIITHLGADGTPEPAGLDPLYSIFGQVSDSSFESVRTIAQQETKGGNDPVEAEKPIVPVFIESIEIIEA